MGDSQRKAVSCVEAGGNTTGLLVDKETTASMIGSCVRYNETPVRVAMKRGLQGPPHTSPVVTRMGVSSISLQRHWEDPCSARLKRNQEALELTAREMRRLSWASWVGTGSEAQSSPFYISYTAPRGRRCERAVVVPSRLLPASEAVSNNRAYETQREKEQRSWFYPRRTKQKQEESQPSLEGNIYPLFSQTKRYRDALQGVFEDWALASAAEESTSLLRVSVL